MNRGEIWDVELNPTQGAEIQKKRPCVVLSSDRVGRLPLRIVVPITAWKELFSDSPWHIQLVPNELNNLDKLSAVDTFQVRSVSIERFRRKRGVMCNRGNQLLDAGRVMLLRV